MKTNNKKNTHSFCFLCRNCGFKFYSNKILLKKSFFSNNSKIDRHRIIPPKFNLFCPECKSQDIAIDFGKIVNSTNKENRTETSIDYNSANGFAEQISVSIIKKNIEFLSLITGKITKADKVKNNTLEHSEKN